MSKYSIKSKKIYNSFAKVIGQVTGDTFSKSIRNNHILRKPPAIACDICSLEQAEAAGAVYFQATDQDSGVIYRAKIDQFWRDGFPVNRGHGDQVGLPLQAFTRQKRGQLQQLDLFERGARLG